MLKMGSWIRLYIVDEYNLTIKLSKYYINLKLFSLWRDKIINPRSILIGYGVIDYDGYFFERLKKGIEIRSNLMGDNDENIILLLKKFKILK